MKEQIDLKAGFFPVEHKTLLSFDQCASYLSSKRNRHISYVEECDRGVIVTHHAHRCPHCGKEIFAYDHEEDDLPSREDIAEWCDLQLDMFSDTKKDPLIFRSPSKNKELFFCPRCGVTQHYSEDIIPLQLEIEKSTVSLTRPIQGIDQLLEIPWLKVIGLNGTETLFEKISFDLQSGTARLSIENEEGFSPASRFLVQRASVEELGFFGLVLRHNRIVKRKLKKAFQSFHPTPIPFTLRELDFNHFLQLTMFVGFPRSFYDAIPWDRRTGWIMEDFHFPSSLLHSPENAMKIMAKKDLPMTKSVKRIFAETPGLFFYLPECKKLWELLSDLNYFCALLRLDHIFYILATLHQYPGAFVFCEDYQRIRGSRGLLLALKNHFLVISSCAITYSALSPCAREQMQEDIRQDRDLGYCLQIRPQSISFSYPLSPLPFDGKEINVGDYSFKWLKNTADCRRASIELVNCLAEWNGLKNPVADVLDGREYVAAIEVQKDEVIQFLGKENCAIEENTPLYSTIQKWAKHFSLNLSETISDDLPF